MSIPDCLGDFKIVEEIGRGGFGVVYRAQQLSLDRPVALKVLYQHRVHTTEEVGRFEREARAAGRLDHPAIVSVYAWGQEGTDFYIAQKLVGSGQTVADELAVLKETGNPPKGYFRRVAEWLAVVAEGLQHAHERGIVHRDVKPSNILLNDDGRPYLGDFGLAKVEDGLELSRTGDFAGSPYYMSPEQADSRRGEVDHRSDIYALGVTLYELLTLEPPFLGQSSHEIIRKILTEEPVRPTRVASRVPTDLETICLKAMEKNRIRRYQSAEAFAHDLRSFLDGEPISAAPPSTVSRIFRRVRRERAKVGLIGLSVLVVLAGYFLNKQNKAATLSRSQGEVAQQLRTAPGDFLDELKLQGAVPGKTEIEEAKQANDAELALELMERQEKISDFLDEGSQIMANLLPTIADSEVVNSIKDAMEDQFLFGGLTAAKEFLETQQSGPDAVSDPENLNVVTKWLSEMTTELKGFDVGGLGITLPPGGGEADDGGVVAGAEGGQLRPPRPVEAGLVPSGVAAPSSPLGMEAQAVPVPPAGGALPNMSPMPFGAPKLVPAPFRNVDPDLLRRAPWLRELQLLRTRLEQPPQAARSEGKTDDGIAG